MALRPVLSFTTAELLSDPARIFDPMQLTGQPVIVINVPDIGSFARVVTQVPLSGRDIVAKANLAQQLLSSQARGEPSGTVLPTPFPGLAGLGGIPVPAPTSIPVNPLIPRPPMAIPVAPSASLLGDIAKIGLGAIGGFATGGFGGAVVGGLGAAGVGGGGGGVIGPGQSPPVQQRGGLFGSGFNLPGTIQSPVVINPPFAGAPGAGVTFQTPFGGAQTEEELLMQLAETGIAAGEVALGCPRGKRANKSSYWRRGPGGSPMFVPKGSRCVSNRRMNPSNGRATKRAISRIKSAKRLAKDLSRITVRERKCR